MHVNETENMMGDILNDYAHLISRSPQDFNREFGAYVNKNKPQ